MSKAPRPFLALLLLSLGLTAQVPRWQIQLPVSGSTSQVLSPEGDRLALAPTFGPVLAFETRNGSLAQAWTRPMPRSYSLAWRPDGKAFYAGDPDGRDGFGLRTFGGAKAARLRGGTHVLAPSPGGRWLASIDYETLRILDLRTGKLITWMEEPFRTWRIPVSNVRLLAWTSPDELLVVQGGWGGGVPFAVKRYNLAQRRERAAIPLPEGRVASALALDAAHRTLWLGTTEGHLLTVDLEAGEVRSDAAVAAQEIETLAHSPGRLALWAGSEVRLLDPAEPAAPLRTLPAWSTPSSGNGWRPVLAWIGGDLLLAGAASEGGWRAVRWGLARPAPPEPRASGPTQAFSNRRPGASRILAR